LDYIGSGNATAVLADSGDSKIYLESCVIAYDTGTAGTRQIVRAHTDAFVTMTNCSFYLFDGPGGTEHAVFRYQAATGIKARQCVFQADADGEDRELCVGDASVAASLHDFVDCWYDNIDTNDYSQNTSFDSQAEWESVIDGNGVYDTDPGYTSATDLTPTLTSALRTTKKTTTWPTPRVGINDYAYDGSYGAYQGLV